MAAGIYNFTIEQGTTFQRVFKYKDSNGNPIDLSEIEALRMQIRENIEDTDPVTGGEFDLDNGFTRSIPTGESIANQFTLLIPSAITAGFNFTNAFYDIELVDGSSVTTRLLQGKIKLSKEVTR
jgi:hypothetical protein